jgi:hypothetical protein
VVLVPGFTNDAGWMSVWQRSLQADGFRTFTFPDPNHCLGDLRVAAGQLGQFVAGVEQQTGAAHVSIVAYSAGITTARAWMSLDGGAPNVRRVVDLDGSWDGDDDSHFLNEVRSVPVAGPTLYRAMPTAEMDTQRSSPLYADIHQHPAVPSGVQVTSIYPQRFGVMDYVPGAANVVLPDAPGHIAMARSSDTAYEAGRAALLAPLAPVPAPADTAH